VASRSVNPFSTKALQILQNGNPLYPKGLQLPRPRIANNSADYPHPVTDSDATSRVLSRPHEHPQVPNNRDLPPPEIPRKKPRPGHLTMPSLGPCCPSFWRANRLMRIFRHQLARRGKPPVRPRCHTRGNANRTHQVMAAATRPLPANASFPPGTSLAASIARPGRRSNRAAWRSCPACWREPRPCRSRPSPAPPSAA